MKKANDSCDDYDYLGNSASASDCTGLCPSAPEDDFQMESYEEVYHYLPPEVEIDKDKKR